MNLSSVVTRIKLKLGLFNLATPFEDLDGLIMDILKDITIPVYSLYNPCKDTLVVNTQDLEKIEKTNMYQVYLLPEFKNRKLLYVFDVSYNDTCSTGFGYYGGEVPLMTGSLIGQTMLANAGASLMNSMIPKMSFKYEAPRKLYLYNSYSSCGIVIELGFEHDKSLASIPETSRESFMELALLDVKENLYPTMKQYTEINTALANVNLKIDDWANAEADRKELINRWDDMYHIDNKFLYYF